nr:MAG TPA: hypothetical protein [Caudoviricetes sp.]
MLLFFLDIQMEELMSFSQMVVEHLVFEIKQVIRMF